MADIMTITLNPTVDISTAVDVVRPGPKLRCDMPEADPGGGGINVSRAIRLLGGESQAFVALGGVTGQRLAGLLVAEGIRFDTFSVEGETRQSFAVTDRASGGQYRFVMPGPDWSLGMVDDALAAIGATIASGSLVVLSGSNPPGVPDDFARKLSARLRGTSASVIVDTSGQPLHYLVNHPCGISVLRMDAAEAEDLAGHALPDRSEGAAFARMLVRRGVAETVIIARGADGSTLVSKTEALHCSRPVSTIISAVGAGDSFVGAFALALGREMAMSEALRHGTAAASAAVLTPATQLCSREDAERLLSGCQLTEF